MKMDDLPLNKIPGDRWWSALLDRDAVDSALFAPEDIDEEKARELFRKFVCIVNIETSSYCNRKCSYCPDAIYDRSSNIRMEDAVFDRILHDLKRIGYASTISLNLYNEPLADKDIFRRIAQVRQALPNAFIKFNSNGDYLNREMLDRLVEIGNNAIFVTLHPRPGVAYSDEDRLKHFKKFFKRIGEKMTIDVREAGRRMVSDQDYRGMRLRVMADNWGDYGNSRGDVVEFLKSSSVREAPCVRPFREFTIYHDGQVYPCCQFFPESDPENRDRVGTVQEADSLFELYVSPKLAGYREHLFGFGPKLAPCASCADPDFADTRSAGLRNRLLAEARESEYGRLEPMDV